MTESVPTKDEATVYGPLSVEAEIEQRIVEFERGACSTDRLHEALGWTRDELAVWIDGGETPARPLRLRSPVST